MATDWRSAFFEQAHSDFRTLSLLQEQRAHTCQQVHYLQMTIEKLSKGFLAQSGWSKYPQSTSGKDLRTHEVVDDFFHLAPRNPKIGRALGITDLTKLRAHFDKLTDIALAIEKTVPAIAGNGPNAEYPWSEGAHVVAPVEYDFSSLDIQKNSNVRKLSEFIEKCFTVV